MNLMIVEDEPILLHNLANNIPWHELGIDVIGAAVSGEEAIAMFDRKKPNLVLLDIQMPGISGLELAQWIRERDTLVRIIVLSGHDSFEFAQRALKLGISNYLLKPAGETEIKKAVSQAANELREELEQMHNQSLLQQKWSQHLPFLREMFLQSWLQGSLSSWEIQERSRDVLLNITEHRNYCVAVVDMDPLQAGEIRFSSKDASLLQFSVKCIAKESLEAVADWIASTSNGCTAIVFADAQRPTDTFLQEVNANVGKLLTIIQQCLKLTASAGISSCSDKPESLAKLYEQAHQALQKRILYGNQIVVTYLNDYEQDKAAVTQPELERELTIALETGKKAKASEMLDILWQEVMSDLDSVDQVYEGVLYFMALFVRIIQQRGCSVKEVIGEDAAYIQNMQVFSTKEQVKDCLERMLCKVSDYFDRKQSASGRRLVDAALAIIEEGIHVELTLHSVAERLYINSSYLSRLFKQEIGKPFSTYVLERKMEQAKTALLEGAKVYDAADAVGYRDVSYFTKVFRRYWGTTPGEVSKS